MAILIIVASLPVPIGYLHAVVLERLGRSPSDPEAEYVPCATTDTDLIPLDTNSSPWLAGENADFLLQNGNVESMESSMLWKQHQSLQTYGSFEWKVWVYFERFYFDACCSKQTFCLFIRGHGNKKYSKEEFTVKKFKFRHPGCAVRSQVFKSDMSIKSTVTVLLGFTCFCWVQMNI